MVANVEFSKDMLHGKWNFVFVFTTPATSVPSITLQLAPFTASRTVLNAESHPKTITESYLSTHFLNFMR